MIKKLDDLKEEVRVYQRQQNSLLRGTYVPSIDQASSIRAPLLNGTDESKEAVGGLHATLLMKDLTNAEKLAV